MNRSRVTGNLSSHGILFSDITNDRVGIGSTIPTEKLDVIGNIRAGNISLQESNNNDLITGTSSNGLKIRSTAVSITQPASPNNIYASFNNTQCDLRSGGSQIFRVHSSGVEVTGNMAATGTLSGESLTLSNSNLIINGTIPKILFSDSDSNPDYEIKINGGTFDIRDSTNNASRLAITASGASITGTLAVSSTITASGNIFAGSDSSSDIGTTSVRFANGFFDTLYGAGSNITALNGSNIASGTVPVARIGTGTKSTSTFYRGDGTFATVTPPAITTINSASNNRVVTSDGGTTVTAESNLTWDGSTLNIGGNTAWHSNNDGAGSGLDADTLDGVQGASFLRSDASDTTSGTLTTQILAFGGTSGNSNNTAQAYALYQAAGAWNHPYPDLIIAYHTGIRIGGHYSYGGTRFYNDYPEAGGSTAEIFSVGNGDSHVRVANNLYIGGNTAWHVGNDGSGSGLDADLLDGQHGSRFLTSYSSSYTGGWEQTNRNFRVTTGGNAAGLVFHESDGTFAFQLYGDGTAFGFLTGNWGNWDVRKVPTGDMFLNNSNTNKVWHAGNDGSGSGLDADTVDGLQVGSTANTGSNQLVRTEANGYILSGYINTTANDTGAGTDCVRFYASEDAYIRYLDKASMRAVMNTPARSSAYAGRENDTTDQNYWIGSSGWSNANFDTTVWDYGSCFFDVWSNPSGQPSGATHWNGFQAMHYTNASSRYGMRITMGGGNPAYAYIQGRWNTTTYGWHKLWNAGNDGSGSGLDADTVDGIEGASFLRSDANDTAVGDLTLNGTTTFNSGAGAVTVGGGSDIRFTTGTWTGNHYGKIQLHSNHLYIMGGNSGDYSWIFRFDGNDRVYIKSDGTIWPTTHDSSDLGTTANRWRNIYTTDLQLSNKGKEGGNSVDGSWGDWTLQEGEDKIFMINNRTGKKYSLIMKEEN